GCNENKRDRLPADFVNHNLAGIFLIEALFSARSSPEADRGQRYADQNQSVLQQHQIEAKEPYQPIGDQQPNDRSPGSGPNRNESHTESRRNENSQGIHRPVDLELPPAFCPALFKFVGNHSTILATKSYSCASVISIWMKSPRFGLKPPGIS